MKALFILPEYPPSFGGGIATYYGALLTALARRGVHVTAIVGSALADGPPAGVIDGVTVRPLDRERARALRTRFPDLDLAPDFVAHLAAAWAAWEQTGGGAGFDVVECTDWGLLYAPWLIAADAPPTVVRLHGSIGQIAAHDPQPGHALSEALARFTDHGLLRHARCLATYGRPNQTWWTEHLAREVAYAAPPLALPPPEPAAAPATGGALIAGRVQAWKGPRTLCLALRRLGASAPHVRWFGRDIGIGDLLRREFPDIWGPVVRAQPPLPPTGLRAARAAARLVIVPSDWDVFNYTAAEALAEGAIVVCSRGAGAADLIKHGVNGFLFDAGDEAALADCLRQASGLSVVQEREMRRRARETVHPLLAPETVAAAHLENLEAARAAAPRPPPAEIAALLRPGVAAAPAVAGLGRLPLRELARHVAGRIARKIPPSK